MDRITDLLFWPLRQFSKIVHAVYAWVESFAQKPNAARWLAGISFAESSFFPIPPDPLLMANVFVKPKDWRRLATITIVSSILGGIFGYFLGKWLMNGPGQWVIDTYHLQDDFDRLGNSYQGGAFLAVLGAALTPVPYKIITLSAGGFGVSFLPFVIASIIGRGLRFAAVAYLAQYMGEKHKDHIVRYIDYLSIVLIVIAIGAYLLLH